MKNYLSIFLILLLSSCSDKKTLDLGKFTISIPNSWNFIKEKGIDSYVGKIAIDETDTLFFDLGWYSSPLDEELPYMIEGNRVLVINKEKSNHNSSFYDYYGELDTVDLSKFLKNKVSFERLENRNAKIVIPRKPGYGTTGIFIDSLWVSGDGIDRFTLCGENLNPQNEKLFLEAIRTIKFRK